MVHQGVTLGQRRGPEDKITIGDNVSVFAGAKILGNLKIGDNVKIAANAILLTDAVSNSTYAGIPAVKIQ
jgi:serine O-acetyltransferase